jgi:hypothetical protein
MIPPEQPNIPHTQPAGPVPKTGPGTGAPACATVDEIAIDAANAAARIFDFLIAHLFPDSRSQKDIISLSAAIDFRSEKPHEMRVKPLALALCCI